MRLRNRRKYLTRPGCKTAACDRNSTVCVKYLHKTIKNLTKLFDYALCAISCQIFSRFERVSHNILWLGFSSPFPKDLSNQPWTKRHHNSKTAGHHHKTKRDEHYSQKNMKENCAENALKRRKPPQTPSSSRPGTSRGLQVVKRGPQDVAPRNSATLGPWL